MLCSGDCVSSKRIALLFFFKQKTAYAMRISDWSSDVCSSDLADTIPPFMYGSHYSSAAIVLYYLVRLEPYTSAAIRFQGGHFDHAARMFHSQIGRASCRERVCQYV